MPLTGGLVEEGQGATPPPTFDSDGEGPKFRSKFVKLNINVIYILFINNEQHRLACNCPIYKIACISTFVS